MFKKTKMALGAAVATTVGFSQSAMAALDTAAIDASIQSNAGTAETVGVSVIGGILIISVIAIVIGMIRKLR